MNDSHLSWTEANQKHLMRAVDGLRCQLEQVASGSKNETETSEVAFEMDSPAALDQLCETFRLSAFERHVLVLCAGIELDSNFAELVARVQKGGRAAATFSLALAIFPEAHWSALSPSAPLRYWRLVELGSGESLATSPLRLDERVLHFLSGVPALDERLRPLLERVRQLEDLPKSQLALAESISRIWSSQAGALPTVIQLAGEDSEARRAVSAAACTRVGQMLYAIPAEFFPHAPAEADAFARLWRRESLLGGCALLIEFTGTEARDGARDAAIQRFLESSAGLLLTSSSAPRGGLRRHSIVLDVDRPPSAEQKVMWRRSLGAAGAHLNGALDALGAQFSFEAPAIREVCERALHAGTAETDLERVLWEACRTQARSRMDDLARRIVPAATWDDLVLPPAQLQILREIGVHVRQRHKVYEQWGFASKGSRGLGISALFAGPSGTGKTMAAEVLANELRLDLNVIDLSQVVSKYIGETEKNLRRVFDAAERGGSILLFDEADALFGKRSDVKDSHDRYANVEISYLLQRMEAYRGLALLTTNMKSALDTAFLRRIRFVVQFPFPDAAARADIWRRIYPADAPTEGLDFDRLATLDVAGGNIRNIALHAAFSAAEANQRVDMSHLLRAARTEYAKLEKPPTQMELGQ